jgi:hypothetical protein
MSTLIEFVALVRSAVSGHTPAKYYDAEKRYGVNWVKMILFADAAVARGDVIGAKRMRWGV